MGNQRFLEQKVQYFIIYITSHFLTRTIEKDDINIDCIQRVTMTVSQNMDFCYVVKVISSPSGCILIAVFECFLIEKNKSTWYNSWNTNNMFCICWFSMYRRNSTEQSMTKLDMIFCKQNLNIKALIEPMSKTLNLKTNQKKNK